MSLDLETQYVEYVSKIRIRLNPHDQGRLLSIKEAQILLRQLNEALALAEWDVGLRGL